MQITLPPINLHQQPTKPASPSNRNDHQEASTHQRHRRSIDSSPPKDQKVVQEVVPDTNSSKDGYNQVNVNPDPGKGVGVGDKVPEPINLGPNISVDPVTQEVSDAFKTVKEEASIFLKNKFAEMTAKATTPAEREKWNIDPDNTYLVTYDYNTTGEKPYPAKIIKRISLTEALITNAQDTPTGAGYQVPFYPGGPEVIVNPELKTHTPGIFNFSSRFNPYTEKADITHTYQGIYIESTEGPAPVYNGGNQSSITPDEFKQLIWKADYQKPYDQFLNEFWSNHEKNYPLLAKASLVKAAMGQHQEQSLSKEARDLVMRASGLSGNEASWPDIKLEDLQKNPPKDPDIEVGMLKVGNFQSTDLMYITDKKVKFDANGKKLPPLTLLHIPGNSSPIHTFNSPAEMKAWFAEQMADPVKREAMAGHFPLKDKPNGYAQAGIDETLAGLGTWPEKRETPGGLLSYEHRAFSGFWDPQDFIKAEPSHSPFDEITTRQKDRSYSDAAVDITSDGDVTKNTIISGLEKAAKAALFLIPLAFVIPEVALALDAFYLASGITEAGIGIDDKIHGKPTGNQRIIFGVFNAAIAVTPHLIGAGGKESEIAVTENAHPQPKPEPEALPERPGQTDSPSPTPETKRIDGTWSEWLGFGDTPAAPLLNDNFRLRMDNTKYGPKAAEYQQGYTQGKPENIKGYSSSMNSVEIKKLALEPARTPEEFGTLVRTLEKRRAAKSLESFLIFKRETEAAGGTVRGMPQDFYLSHVDVLTKGECAAMSNTMALAIAYDRENVFIDNLFKAAGSDSPEAIAFRTKLSTLHESIAESYHGGQSVRKITHSAIIDELADAIDSTTLKISDNGHGFIAGVKIENNNKLFFFYDPNFGLAKFPTKDAMKKGLERLLNSGPVAKAAYKPVGYESSMPLFNVSTFRDGDFYVRSGRINPNDFFSRPL